MCHRCQAQPTVLHARRVARRAFTGVRVQPGELQYTTGRVAVFNGKALCQPCDHGVGAEIAGHDRADPHPAVARVESDKHRVDHRSRRQSGPIQAVDQALTAAGQCVRVPVAHHALFQSGEAADVQVGQGDQVGTGQGPRRGLSSLVGTAGVPHRRGPPGGQADHSQQCDRGGQNRQTPASGPGLGRVFGFVRWRAGVVRFDV